MTEPYVPRVGHRVTATVLGTVTRVEPYYAVVDGMAVSVPNATWTRLPDPEPDWEPGDIVIDATNDVYVRGGGGGDFAWHGFGQMCKDENLIRPLTRLVRETPA